MGAARKRARAKGGKFRGDDPSTPDINEAWEEPTVVTKKKAAPKKKAAAGLPPLGSAAYKAMILRGEIKE